MEKAIYFYLSPSQVHNYHDERYGWVGMKVMSSYDETCQAIKSKDVMIATTSIVNLNFGLCDKGYEIYLVRGLSVMRIYPGMTLLSGKELKKTSNLAKAVVCGEFDNDLLHVVDKSLKNANL